VFPEVLAPQTPLRVTLTVLGVVFVFAALLGVLATPLAIWLANRFGAVDDPTRDSRRIHTQITPRWGGVGVYIAFVGAVVGASWLLFRPDPFPSYLVGVLAGGTLISIMGMIDDRFGLTARYQTMYMLVVGFGVQIFGDSQGAVYIDRLVLPGIGAIAVWPVLAALGTAFYLFVVTKTMDTIDGVDGLAAGIAMISSLTLAALALMAHQPRAAMLSVAMAGACMGFLRWNAFPARIFLAGGAQFVGFTLACISIVGPINSVGPLALLIPFTVFGVPVIDAVVVVLRRLKARAHITVGDRRHTHHALLDAGLTKRQTVFVLYGVSVVLSGLILVLAWQFRP
jgi:UDP-GlcNAc:undecaprenyl-phosphate GlcNAc-1-phosphate transferase